MDVREIATWRESVEVGNAYINRSITGAIVNRQPFGGWKKSCFGPGAKAGGPNYVAQFGTWRDCAVPEIGSTLSDPLARQVKVLSEKSGVALDELEASAASYTHWMRKEFSIEHDPTGLHGEDNHFRYIPLKKVLVRLTEPTPKELANVVLAAIVTGVEVDFSMATKAPEWLEDFSSVLVESDADLVSRMKDVAFKYSSLRAPDVSENVARAANDAALQVVDWSVLSNGRIELLHYFREQSISETTHRYGNIIPTPDECVS